MQTNTRKICLTLKQQRGLSLIELMLAMTLGLMIVAGMATLFLQSRQSFNQDELISQMQDDARFAMGEIIRDVSLGGFWATLLDPANLVTDITANTTLGADCGDGTANWMYVTSRSITAFDEPVATTAPSATFSCMVDAEVQANTDILAIKRVVASPTAVGSLVADTMYLETNGVRGLLFEQPKAGVPTEVITGTLTYWEYRPSIYFIQNYEITVGDGVPTLCRYALVINGGSPTMTKECLASGVQDMQIEYGIDSDDDGTANQYISAPTAAQMDTLVSLRVSLLMRSVNQDPSYTSDKTFTIGNKAAYSPTDTFYRRIYTTTINVRNPTNLRTIT